MCGTDASPEPRPDVSVVVPVFNESENLAHTVSAIREVLDAAGRSYEIVLVNDGSTDDTAAKMQQLAAGDPTVVPVGYPVNAGRGRALRTGFRAARGAFVVSIDADLSYHPGAILELLAALKADPSADFAVGSPYARGGRAEGVPRMRLWISRTGNWVLRRLMPGGFRTYTGIFRCYRREMIQSLVLHSDGKEIHLEIMTKALALGFKGVEVPATLRGRKRGRSKFRFRRAAASHIVYGIHERPMVIFGLVGLGILLLAVGMGIYLLVLSASGVPVAGRPMLLFAVFLALAAILAIAIGFIAIQNVALRKELYRLAGQSQAIADRLEELAARQSGSGGAARQQVSAEGPEQQDQ